MHSDAVNVVNRFSDRLLSAEPFPPGYHSHSHSLGARWDAHSVLLCRPFPVPPQVALDEEQYAKLTSCLFRPLALARWRRKSLRHAREPSDVG